MAALALALLGCGAAPSARAEEIFAITGTFGGVSLFRFDSATPGVIRPPVLITGTQGEDLYGIDFRPATGQLYGIGIRGGLYTLDTATGAASRVSASVGGVSATTLGTDFNPVGDYLRVVAPEVDGLLGRNLRIDVDAGRGVYEGRPRYAPGDPNFGRRPNRGGLAYTNSYAGASSTTVYGIDAGQGGVLVRQDPDSEGLLSTVGSLGITVNSTSLGFDISGVTGVAYVGIMSRSGANANVPLLYTIDLSTGAATHVGRIGNGAVALTTIRGIAVALPVIPEPSTLALLGTGTLGLLSLGWRRRRRTT